MRNILMELNKNTHIYVIETVSLKKNKKTLFSFANKTLYFH